MIQDIAPSKFNNAFGRYTPSEEDTVFVFDAEGRLFADISKDPIAFTRQAETGCTDIVYLFLIDEKRYFLALDKDCPAPEGYEAYAIRKLRDEGSGTALFAAFTAYHLWKWYNDNRFCGRCGKPLLPATDERALCCKDCGNIIYPRINPAVIVGVINDDRILITRYRRGYSHNALIAGFTEIGETLEQTVAREVMEEAGIRVKNIRYYRSQPWGMAEDLLVGFFCEADGDTVIRMDENELKYAAWTTRDELELQPNNLSITNEMMRMFKENRI